MVASACTKLMQAQFVRCGAQMVVLPVHGCMLPASLLASTKCIDRY